MPEGRQSRARGHLNIRIYKSADDGLINQLRITLEYKSTAGRDLEALQPMRSPLRLERELWSPIFANLVHCELVVGRNLPNRLMYWSQTPWKKLVFLDKRPLVALWEALDPFLPAHIEVQIIDNDTKPLGEELEVVKELIHGCLKKYPAEEPDIVGGSTGSEGSSACMNVKD